MKSALSPLVLVSCLITAAAPLTGSPWIVERGKLLAADEAPSTAFGVLVAVSGDTAIVGKYGVGGEKGAAYIFVRARAGWSQQAKLVPSDWEQNQHMQFGTSVAISGETAIVAAYQGHPDVLSGAVYVFVRSGSSWSEQAKLVAPDAYELDAFAGSIAISGDTIVVGANSYPRGAVYIFVRSGSSWSLEAKLFAPDGSTLNGFGGSFAISEDLLAVGAPSNWEGGVYLFRRSNSVWQAQGLLQAAGGRPHDSFGLRLAISGDTLVVGAPGTGFESDAVGVVYVFVDEGSSWAEQARLRASDEERDGLFGWDTALSGDTLVVGALGDSTRQGKAYLFVRNGSTWSERARLHASDGAPRDFLGISLAVSGGTVLVGAYLADDPGVAEDVGAVYLFDAPGPHVAPTELLVTQAVTPFSVTLDTEPSGDVVIDLASSDVGAGMVSPDRLTFTPGNWSTPQTVSVLRVAESGPPYRIALGMNQELTGDAFYAGLDPEDVLAIPLQFTGDFYSVPFCRVLDTRLPGQEPPLTAGVNRTVTFHDTCGVPATARAVAIAVTVVQPTQGGHLTLYPGDSPGPGLEHLAFGQGKTRTIHAIVPLAADGTGTLTVAPRIAAPLVSSGGSADLVIDVSGYFE